MRNGTLLRPPWRHIVAVSVAGAMLASCHRSTTPPNVLLYVVDTLRFDAVHCNGNAAVQTPAMDRLAREGVRFERAYANASWTRASMGSLLTAQYPTVHGAVGRHDALRPGLPTLAAQLRALGYRTAAIVANPNIGSTFGFGAGFDEFIELYQPHTTHAAVRPEQLIATGDQVVDRAREWLAHNTARPFFLLVFTIDPHAPYMPPAPYNALYDPEYHGPTDGSFKSLFALAMLGKTPPEREIRHLRALYDGEAAFNDAQLLRLLASLDADRRLSDSTVVGVTADHGEEFWEHGERDHGHTLYEELIHVPLIMRWPGVFQPGSAVGSLVQLADVPPTLIRLAGGTPPPGPGHDLSGLLTGRDSRPVTSTIYAEEDLDGHRLHALVADTRKLIVDAAKGESMAFDLSRDPGELHALAGGAPPDLLATLYEVEASMRSSDAAPAATVAIPNSVREAMNALGYTEPTVRR